MTKKTPRIEIDLAKIAHNVRTLIESYGAKGIRSFIGVTKGVCGDPVIARVFRKNGISILADSRIENFQRMEEAGIRGPFLLLRLPTLSEVEAIVGHAEYSLNSEISVIRGLSEAALKNDTVHKVILMVELGDLREGVMPQDLEAITEEVLPLKGVKLVGIGSNLGCYGGVEPDDKNMSLLSSLAQGLEKKYRLQLQFVSIGCSNTFTWLKAVQETKRIDNVRVGDALLLGGRDLKEHGIPGLYYDAFTLIAEVIEAKTKPSVPWGEIGLDAFGSIPKFEDRGEMRRLILNIGRQDFFFTLIYPRVDIEILGASSDHLLADGRRTGLQVGDEVAFDLDYGAMLVAMTSPYVQKIYLNSEGYL
jgi:predicted amino acid racemase